MTFQEFANKKVLGVPVLYLAAGFVTVLAIVAWRMKSTPDTETSGTTPEDGVAGTDIDDPQNALAGMEGSGAYSGYVTNGTVVVQPTTPEAEEPPEVNNDTWRKGAAEWLVAQKKATGVDAYSALSKYLDGDNLSFEEGALVNAAIAEKGLPPEPVAKVGTIATPATPAPAPAQKQFNNFPGTHVVKGTNDNTAAKLSTLYYGVADALHTNKIAAANTGLGPVTTTYSTGAKVVIPVYFNPRYYVVTGKSDTYPSQVAAKNGITYQQIGALNPGVASPYNKGARIRVL